MRRVRYIVALPLSIIFWYISTGILIGILVAMDVYAPPVRPGQTWSQGFWSAVMAASLYLIGSIVLMVNMLGYFLGHYPQHFELDDDQRTLILQTMMFFIWLAGGAGIYQKVCGFKYADALYFCDVTILTVGFGDFVPNNNLGRGLLFPYAVIGIIFLGLMINSLRKFASGINRKPSVVRLQMRRKFVTSPRVKRREKLILLREEKDRFDAMREIQSNVRKFKQYYALSMSIFAFSILWCGGATVFWKVEKREQNLTYFEALYFCYVSLLTIGYGDFAPKSNAGKPFFVVWSLIAIPTMTILISDMSSTVIAAINRGTFTLADWTIMPKAGVWHDFLMNHPKLHEWLSRRTKEREAKQRIRHGFEVQNPDDRQISISNEAEPDPESTSLGQVIEDVEEPSEHTEHDLARKLATSIKRVTNDLRADKPKKYSYEEWVEFTRLIRFSAHNAKDVEREEDDEGLVEWDWIGEDSPMLADVSETEWILDRLCESLNRYTRRQGRASRQEQKEMKRLQDGEKKHLHREAHHNMHYPPHPGPRTPRSDLRRNSVPIDGEDSTNLQGASISDQKNDEEIDNEEN
ncbi:e81b35ae-da43-46ea-9648-487375b6f3e0 [Sclerotinia trifoliorum]|uniref:E81b35ae-da43-46ea-9648-487375b6f3e0 n=1 Tax=Sclerotinia trifoliorum TaxID=28548 RepID=A0A8H2W1W2_9HELO|nr:e81b35ae-da43-46ea-9648-487375b6f3e0 [Sclerotinia trifoliorum]